MIKLYRATSHKKESEVGAKAHISVAIARLIIWGLVGVWTSEKLLISSRTPPQSKLSADAILTSFAYQK